jgi:hypothetical protein
MDPRIFTSGLMGLKDQFGLKMEQRIKYDQESNALFVDVSRLVIAQADEVYDVFNHVRKACKEAMQVNGGKKVRKQWRRQRTRPADRERTRALRSTWWPTTKASTFVRS